MKQLSTPAEAVETLREAIQNVIAAVEGVTAGRGGPDPRVNYVEGCRAIELLARPGFLIVRGHDVDGLLLRLREDAAGLWTGRHSQAETANRLTRLRDYRARLLAWKSLAEFASRPDRPEPRVIGHRPDDASTVVRARRLFGTHADRPRYQAPVFAQTAPGQTEPEDFPFLPAGGQPLRPAETGPTSPQPPESLIEAAMRDVPRAMADMDNTREFYAPAPEEGQRIVLHHRLVKALGEQNRHGKAASEWAIHRLVEKGMLTARYGRGDRPSWQTRDGAWHGGDSYEVRELKNCLIG